MTVSPVVDVQVVLPASAFALALLALLVVVAALLAAFAIGATVAYRVRAGLSPVPQLRELLPAKKPTPAEPKESWQKKLPQVRA